MINWNDLKEIKYTLRTEIDNIFKVYNYLIEIRAEDINVLKSKDSCIRSSTAIGYVLEEFIYQKLKNVMNYSKSFEIFRNKSSTQSCSYDFLVSSKKYDLLVNVKTENRNSANNAIAAINQLYKDYSKHILLQKDFYYIILKIKYEIDTRSTNDNEIIYLDKVKITDFDIYSLEEISFDKGFTQDHRNWGKEYKPISGRLHISKKFYTDNKLSESDEISNKKTFTYLDNMIAHKIT
ncbi:hypothetical protein E1I18_01310 [Mycoplasmopsis mucosicanis]|uniref:Restriction endonuclease n=1 Tax=Mycoplasmopsis mucosicanis TaxID=458208 RepID=A0A507SXI0_9BACT|nr:hypothetical protein [Mycoplasmopsis mucosicanis]TQC53953.1 hypothetical protein E1I18_01310 [Mycoplasmopsis mucosicanis]